MTTYEAHNELVTIGDDYRVDVPDDAVALTTTPFDGSSRHSEGVRVTWLEPVGGDDGQS